MKKNRAPSLEQIAQVLLSNSANIRYGDVSVTLRVHNRRIVAVVHTVTHSTREDHSSMDTQGGNDESN